MEYLSPIAVGAVVVFAAIAGATDIREFRVPNALTIPMLVAGVLYHATTGGFAALQSSLLGAGCGFGILFGFYLLGAMGAGDVKLMAGVGAWLGAGTTVYVFGIAAAATALYSVVVLLRYGGIWCGLATIHVTLCQLCTMAKHLGANERVESVVRRDDRRRRLVPFAAMVSLAVIAVLIWKQLA